MMNHEIVENGSVSLVSPAATVRAYMAGNMAALLKRLAGTVYNVTHGQATREQSADLVQTALVKCLESAEKYDASRGTVPSWCSLICKSVILDTHKCHSNANELAVLDAPTTGKDGEVSDSMLASTMGTDGVRVMLESADYSQVARAISKLDGDQQGFLADILNGDGIGESGAKLGWSAMTSSRKYAEIIEFLQDECKA